ncbi:MAG: hypothetical protein NZ518_11700, partial [Dehalococcoidia bacterium]|nr:hypothetical protein [Dehalococcoidia bacterium]
MTATRADLVMRWALTVATFAARLAQLPDTLLRYAPRGDPWCVGDIVYHTAKGLTYPRDLVGL